MGTTTTVVSVYSGIALKRERSTGSRTKPASAAPSASTPGASAAVTETRSSGMSGSRSPQIRTHFAGVTPGTYARRNDGGVSEPVTSQGYRARSSAPQVIDTLDGMTSHKTTQTMKPATAAKKLGVYLEATPAEFQEGVVSRDELNALQAEPPQWLLDLRRDGPHPRPVVAAKLGVSISGLARGGVTEALTTERIEALKAENPEWAAAGAGHPGRGPQGSGPAQGEEGRTRRAGGRTAPLTAPARRALRAGAARR